MQRRDPNHKDQYPSHLQSPIQQQKNPKPATKPPPPPSPSYRPKEFFFEQQKIIYVVEISLYDESLYLNHYRRCTIDPKRMTKRSLQKPYHSQQQGSMLPCSPIKIKSIKSTLQIKVQTKKSFPSLHQIKKPSNTSNKCPSTNHLIPTKTTILRNEKTPLFTPSSRPK